MNIQEVKNIRIADYLQSLGYTPVKQQGNGLWYKSPFREETEASFKVNTDRNLWFDYGLGKGGNIIALAEELYATDHVPYLLNKIAERVPHIRPVSFSFRQHSSEPSFQHLEVGELTHPALLRYLQERGINTDLARLECKELHFIHNGKPYFAIGFPNVAGGYEVQPFLQRLHRTERHQPYPSAGRAEREMPCVRGYDGLPVISYVTDEELPDHAQP